MSKPFKKIYIEIINYCNLNCSFCHKTNKPPKAMSIEEFSLVISQVKEYTDYIYLHVQGEPLMHPHLNALLDIALLNNLKVNLTTNSFFIKDNIHLLGHKAIRQINISLQALSNHINKKVLYEAIITLAQTNHHPYISLRLWGRYHNDDFMKELDYFYHHLGTPTDIKNKITDKVFFSKDDEFTWPNLDHAVNPTFSKCLAPSTHIGILSDGSIIPCCLDKDGVICLGNIYRDNLGDILSSSRYQDFINGFKQNKISEELCMKCTYRNKFKKN